MVLYAGQTAYELVLYAVLSAYVVNVPALRAQHFDKRDVGRDVPGSAAAGQYYAPHKSTPLYIQNRRASRTSNAVPSNTVAGRI